MMRTPREIIRSPVTTGTTISVGVIMGILFCRNIGLLQHLELLSYDFLLQAFSSNTALGPEILLVAETEADLKEFGHPISSAVLANALSVLAASGARVIGVDKYRPIALPPIEPELNSVIDKFDNIIWAKKLGTDDGIPPPEILKGTKRTGFIDLVPDEQGVIRRALLYAHQEGEPRYAFAHRLATFVLADEGLYEAPAPDGSGFVQFGTHVLRPLEEGDGGYAMVDARGYQLLLDYENFARGFPSISLADVIHGRFSKTDINGKVIIVGAFAESLNDSVYTPFADGDLVGRIPGVALHAHFTSQLMRMGRGDSHPRVAAPRWVETSSIIALGFLGALCIVAIRKVAVGGHFAVILAGSMIFGGTIVIAITSTAFALGLWIPIVSLVLAWMFCSLAMTLVLYELERIERRQIMQMFSYQVSEEVAVEIWANRDQLLHNGEPIFQNIEATVMFSDIVGFTTITESREPAVAFAWLTRYREQMCAAVLEHGGVILQFVGDALMVVFGIPAPRESEEAVSADAVSCIKCAIDMRRRIAKLNAESENNDANVAVRIGVDTGPAISGIASAAARLEYSVVGDTVNTAARLESYDKESFHPRAENSWCRILVSEATLDRLGSDFATEDYGREQLKGKRKTTNVYRVLDDCAATYA